MSDIRTVSRSRATLATLLGTVYLALLISLSNRGGWQGYAAGVGDHTVLMPQGIQWAIPGAFQNDWFMSAAPQPHWFFDAIIAFGTAIGATDFVLFVYWLLGLAAFTLATILLALLVAPKQPFTVTFVLLSLSGLTPWMLFGTGTSFIGMALPTVLAGSMLYLTFVLMIRGNLWQATILGVILSAIHVQQGAIVAIVFLVTVVVHRVTDKRWSWPLLAGFLASACFVFVGLKLRPVAANLSDFVEVCNSVIPYHCAAWSWSWQTQFAFAGGLFLAVFSVLSLPKPRRLMWATTIGLVLVGLALGFSADAFSVPVLGELAQAVNVYRLGSVVVPFMLWGVLAPVLTPAAFLLDSRENSRWVRALVLWAVWGASTAAMLLDAGWNVLCFAKEQRLFAIALVLLLAFSIIGVWFWRRAKTPLIAVFSVIALIITSGFATQTLTLSPHFSWYKMAQSETQEWMSEAGEMVPVGGTILAPGESNDLRLYSQRATIVDCKNIPYGGEAWEEWLTRTRDLGVCGSPTFYEDLNASEIEDLGLKYSAEYVVLTAPMVERISEDLSSHGWKLLLAANENAGSLSLYKIGD